MKKTIKEHEDEYIHIPKEWAFIPFVITLTAGLDLFFAALPFAVVLLVAWKLGMLDEDKND